mgnify:FL=1
MKYSFEYIEQKLERKLIDVVDNIQALNIQKEIKGLHNQNRISLDFIESKYYNNYTIRNDFLEHYKTLQHSEKRPFELEVFEQVRKQYVEFDQHLSTLTAEELSAKDLEPYLRLLPRHLDASIASTLNSSSSKDVFCRFGCNKIRGGLDKAQVEHTLHNIQLLEKALDGQGPFPKNLDWNKLLSLCWALVEGGVAEVSLHISKVILKIESPETAITLQEVFPGVPKGSDTRAVISTLWIIASAYLQLEDKEQAELTLQSLIDRYLDNGHTYYLLNNRAAEAAILLYMLNPTIEHLKQSKELLISTSKKLLWEPTETVRERGLIIYDFYKNVLKADT